MRKTGSLRVSVSATLDRDHVVMHPNDGFELGLMRVSHTVRLCQNVGLESYLKGAEGDSDWIQVKLLNECPVESLQMARSLFRLLGEPDRAMVLFDGERLFIHSVP